ncbi:MAG: hypothetical protein EOP86_09840 [Verrucomicrobiaceae bacterium]|nr:MAG: hypothetical protein EOP86_09840 [Verrucomicrobiaceae bacterium]
MPPETHSTDWPAIIAAVFAGLSGLITLLYGQRAKARQEEAATELALIKARAEAAAVAAEDAVKTVQESREERSGQIDGVKADVGALREEVREATHAANGYKGEIADATSATQAIATEVKHMREKFESQPQSRNDH